MNPTLRHDGSSKQITPSPHGGGEVTSRGQIDYERVVRQAIREVGYTDSNEPFCADTVQILLALTQQSAEIGKAVEGRTEDQGAGDQGIMFGYATDETPELMPLSIVLAHALTKGLADNRRNGVVDWLRPDSKAQVSVVYENGHPHHVSHVVVSTQHTKQASQDDVRDYVCQTLAPRVLGKWSGTRNWIAK
jgi:S-adenosylmethionine synthetase